MVTNKIARRMNRCRHDHAWFVYGSSPITSYWFYNGQLCAYIVLAQCFECFSVLTQGTTNAAKKEKPIRRTKKRWRCKCLAATMVMALCHFARDLVFCPVTTSQVICVGDSGAQAENFWIFYGFMDMASWLRYIPR